MRPGPGPTPGQRGAPDRWTTRVLPGGLQVDVSLQGDATGAAAGRPSPRSAADAAARGTGRRNYTPTRHMTRRSQRDPTGAEGPARRQPPPPRGADPARRRYEAVRQPDRVDRAGAD